MTDSTLEFFEEYRTKVAEIQELSTQLSIIRCSAETKMNELTVLENEVQSMKRLITTMIDHGWDPVEAKLKTTDSDRTKSLWVGSLDSKFYTIPTLTTGMLSMNTTPSIGTNSSGLSVK